MKIQYTLSREAQDILDTIDSPPRPSRVKQNSEVWEDERTGVLCKVSNLSGTTMGFAGVTSNHPWYYLNRCPLPGISVFGTMNQPKQCRNLWWFYFTENLSGDKGMEGARQRCRILAAQLEAEGTELAQQIAELCPPPPATPRKEEKPDDVQVSSDLQKLWQNCNSLTTFPVLYNTNQVDYREVFKEILDEDPSSEDLDYIIKYLNEN